MASGSITVTPGYVFADEAITLAKLNQAAVPVLRLDAGAVTERELADGAFTGTKFADGSISAAKLDVSGLADGNYVLAVASGAASWSLVTTLTQFPIGGGFEWWSNTPPAGNFLLLQGQTLTRSDYDEDFVAMFAALPGGAGDGVDTFVLPNMRRRVPYGAGAADTIGNTGGSETVALTTVELPAHSHPTTTPRGFDDNSVGDKVQFSNTPGTGNGAVPSGSAGGGQAHENRMPFMYVNYAVRYA